MMDFVIQKVVSISDFLKVMFVRMPCAYHLNKEKNQVYVALVIPIYNIHVMMRITSKKKTMLAVFGTKIKVNASKESVQAMMLIKYVKINLRYSNVITLDALKKLAIKMPIALQTFAMVSEIVQYVNKTSVNQVSIAPMIKFVLKVENVNRILTAKVWETFATKMEHVKTAQKIKNVLIIGFADLIHQIQTLNNAMRKNVNMEMLISLNVQ